jgi:taurine dioxygenase
LATAMIDSWEVTRLSVALGASVRGIRLASAGREEAARIEDLLHEHLVLFFPDQHLTLEQHVALGGLFGKLALHPLENPFTKHPEIFELAASHGGVADEWHGDLTFQSEPSILSVLRMVRCPALGGDTMWTSLYAAYEGLSAPMRDLCDGLTAIHDALPHNQPETFAVHPVVRVHPVTGKKALYVNEHFTRRIVEMSAKESEAILGYLTRWVTEPIFTVRYRWSEGTVAIWDNRCTQHIVLNDFDGERIVQRVTVIGDKPTGQPPRWAPYSRMNRPSASSRHDQQLQLVLRESLSRPGESAGSSGSFDLERPVSPDSAADRRKHEPNRSPSA